MTTSITFFREIYKKGSKIDSGNFYLLASGDFILRFLGFWFFVFWAFNFLYCLIGSQLLPRKASPLCNASVLEFVFETIWKKLFTAQKTVFAYFERLIRKQLRNATFNRKTSLLLLLKIAWEIENVVDFCRLLELLIEKWLYTLTETSAKRISSTNRTNEDQYLNDLPFIRTSPLVFLKFWLDDFQNTFCIFGCNSFLFLHRVSTFASVFKFGKIFWSVQQ